MSSAQIVIVDTPNGSDVELRISDQNPESSAVIMATYIAENWDVVVEACRRHLVLRQHALDTVGTTEALRQPSSIAASAPKLLNADGTGVLSTEA